ncbi:MAG: folate-binding protein YgfZ [Acidobacteria bacterium]|nr:folate-binding protein YgfZ [Acidobacteriota bacterium]
MFSTQGYDALRSGTALVRRTDRGVIRLLGADRATWLQGLVTNDVRALAPGQRLYSAYLTPQGRMITDLWIAATDDALLLDVPASLAADLAARLDGLIFAEDVQVADVSGEVPCTCLVGAGMQGCRGAGVLGAGVLVPDHTYGVPALVAYGDLDALLDAHGLSALRGVPEVDLETFDVLRIEAGVPKFLVDMTGDTIPLEAGIEDRAISFTKGCYVGQELIVRVTQRGGGRVAKKLVGLALDGDASAVASLDETRDRPAPASGAPIHAGDRAIGHVTSAVFSPRLGLVIALGYVHRDFVNPGTLVEVLDGAERRPAVVTALPFVAPVA